MKMSQPIGGQTALLINAPSTETSQVKPPPVCEPASCQLKITGKRSG